VNGVEEYHSLGDFEGIGVSAGETKFVLKELAAA
jgi:hypothetical protein